MSRTHREPGSTAPEFTQTRPHRPRWDDESLDDLEPDPRPDPPPPAWLSEPTGPLSLWHERLVPERFRGTRWDPGPRGVLVLTAIAGLVIALTATMAMRDQPTVRAVPPITPAASIDSGAEAPAAAGTPATAPGAQQPAVARPHDSQAGGPAPGMPAANAGAGTITPPGSNPAGGSAAAPSSHPATPEIVVSVVGLVERGGLLRFPPGARIADALKSATPKPEADLTGLNLAQPLCDGDQIVIGRTGSRPTVQQIGSTVVNGPTPVSAVSGSAQPRPSGPAAKTNLNTATESELDALPGVGPVTAKAILEWRTKHGRFTSIDQLSEIDGIGPTRLARLRNAVTI
ncbi:helix-hairpin-helix domain-containing protein [Nocardia inohanensis]|uniref:helix-hairpin-helix domain-containing protein n=1 Tax=Nocardia inohanensis TaxID=209246 RepID=UPI000A9F1E3B|nr:helix-hairpin-helix domain-containing protein [Nocardia inohanensis]